MTINIRNTEAAIDYLAEAATLGDRETAEEIGQEFISLCEKSGSETPRYQEEKKLLRSIRETIEKYKDDPIFESHIYQHAKGLEDSLGQFVDILERETQAPESGPGDSQLFMMSGVGRKVFLNKEGDLERYDQEGGERGYSLQDRRLADEILRGGRLSILRLPLRLARYPRDLPEDLIGGGGESPSLGVIPSRFSPYAI